MAGESVSSTRPSARRARRRREEPADYYATEPPEVGARRRGRSDVARGRGPRLGNDDDDARRQGGEDDDGTTRRRNDETTAAGRRRQTTTGLVTLSSDARLYLVRDLADPQPPVMLAGGQSLVEAGSDRRFLCMRAIEPQFTKSNSVEVLLSTHDQSIVVASRTESRDQNLQEKLSAPVLQMAVAPNGRYVACFAADGNLSVMQTSFSKKVLDFDTKTAVAPLQLVWCGEDSVVLRWKQLMLMVGPFGHFLKYRYIPGNLSYRALVETETRSR